MDHYQTLGVAKNATQDDIKKAYRRMAGIHHPDKGGDTAQFQKIQQAYETLSDPQKRQQYDNPNPFSGMGGHGGMGGHAGGFGFPGGFHFNFNGFDINDLFGQGFGQRQAPPTYKTDVWVTLDQVYNGGEQILQFNGIGNTDVVRIDIPKGIEDGEQLRYNNLIPNANLIVEFRVKNHPKFERRGLDLLTRHKISVFDLVVGTIIEFETLSGKRFDVRVNPKTQPGQNLRISGQGLVRNNMVGDQIILLEPYIPDIIDDSITNSILQSKIRKG